MVAPSSELHLSAGWQQWLAARVRSLTPKLGMASGKPPAPRDVRSSGAGNSSNRSFRLLTARAGAFLPLGYFQEQWDAGRGARRKMSVQTQLVRSPMNQGDAFGGVRIFRHETGKPDPKFITHR